MQKKAASISCHQDRLLITGELNFTTVVSLWKESLPLLANCKQWSFDFSQVVSTNSAGLALLLEWIKYAKQLQKSICFYDLPAQLKSIAEVAGVNNLVVVHT